MKKIKIVLFVLMFSLTSNLSFAQDLECAEEPMSFGVTREIYQSIDFGKIVNESVTKEISIFNNTNKDMEIFGFEVPAGISAMSKIQIVKPKQSGIVVFTYYPDIVSKNPATKEVVVKTRVVDENDQIIVKDKKYKIKVR